MCEAHRRGGSVRTATTARVVVAALYIAFSVGGCSATPRAAPRATDIRDYPWKLAPPSAFSRQFLWRQRIVAKHRGRELAFEAVVQRVGDVLTLVGLGPGGTRAFVLKQTAAAVSFEARLPGKIPFPPHFILVDVQRTFLPLAAPPASDGNRRFLIEDGRGGSEEVFEDWRGGVRRERRYRSVDGDPAGEIVIRYGPESGDGRPGTVELTNGWFGYGLRIETVEATELPDL